jgi:mono/diheme cytochrome c family protein
MAGFTDYSSNDHRGGLVLKSVTILWLVLFATGFAASAQDRRAADDVARGRSLALMICANCHVVASDQPSKPILRQRTPTFAALARRDKLDPDWLQTFLATTHRGSDNPTGMPNPGLDENSAKQIIAYLMNLRAVAVGFPAWDVIPSCRGAAAAGYVPKNPAELKNCLDREQSARQQIERDWSNYAPIDRNDCVQSMQWFEPAYTELATCLEMRTQTKGSR